MQANINNNVLEFTALHNLVASNLEAQTEVIKEFLSKSQNIDTVNLNLTNVTEIDSMGINLVVGLFKQVQAKKLKFIVTNASRPIVNLFNLFKLTSYFEVSS